MPFKDKKLDCWGGQVKKVVEGPNFTGLTKLRYWKQIGEELYRYRKLKRGFKTKTAAAAWEADHWRKIKETQVHPPKKKTPTTFSMVCIPYLDNVKIRCKSFNTYRYKRTMVRNLIKFWGEDLALPIQPLEIETYLDHLYDSQGGKKANRELRELNTLFNWLSKRNKISKNPVTPIEQYAEDPFEKYVPPEKDVLLVRNMADSFEKDLIRAFYYSLARSVEIRRLKFTDCDFINRTVWFSTRKRRGGSMDRTSLDMNDNLYEILYRRSKVIKSEYVFPGQDGGQLPKTTLDKILPRIFRSINYKKDENGSWIPKPEEKQVKPFGFHSIRHHVAAHLYLNEGYHVADMQKTLRHKRASTTDAYLKSIIPMKSAKGLSVLDKNNFETAEPAHQEERDLVGYPERV